MLAGLRGDQVDRAGGGVLAVKCSLRALQHFHARKVVEHAIGHRGQAQIDAVQIKGDRRAAIGVRGEGTNAAQVDL